MTSYGRKNGLDIKCPAFSLQFFAKDGPGGEKTEEPTAKKLSDARNEGQVAKGKDLTSAVMLLVLFMVLRFTVGNMGEGFIECFNKNYTQIGDLFTSTHGEYNMQYTIALIQSAALDMLKLLIPFFGIGFIIAIVIELAQVKWKPTSKPLQPKLSKFNPINGIKRMFSVRTLVSLIKQVVILVVIFIVVYNKLKSRMSDIYMLYDIPLISAIMLLGDIIFDIGTVICVIYTIIGIADYVFEKRKFRKDMMMTKQEVKDEWKNTEGNPEVKNKIRQKMSEASRRRMMQAVPEADVVITNPTHFAVALKYEQNKGKAPVVVAKGEDYLATKIKEAARENNIEIVENKPLARMLYYNVELDEEIPPELYQAVAEVLAFVYNIKNKRT
ncbi:MAG TPA: flagellar biosynthesis protein FlhB [Eubacterium sp.]|nr:flagellar biosynthesis protein FlhB [Eubacterium sp.]